MKRFNLRLLTILLLFGLSFSLTGCGKSEQVTSDKNFEWRCQSVLPESDVEYIALKTFFDEVYKRTDGRLKITPFSGGLVVPREEVPAALSSGVIEMAHASGGVFAGVCPVGNFDEGLPGQYPGFGKLDLVMDMLYKFEDGALEDVFRRAYLDQAGVYYLGSHSYHGYPLIISKKRITTVNDLKGMVIRAGVPYSDVFKKIGASPTELAGDDMYLNLQLGTIDAAVYAADGVIQLGLYEVADKIIMPPISDHHLSNMLVNPESWESLPQNIQDIVRDVYINIYTPLVYEEYNKVWDELYEKEKEFGYELVQLSDEEIGNLRDICKNVIWDEYKDFDKYTREAYEIVERYLKKTELSLITTTISADINF